jgi:hypothetical protein
MSIDWSQVTERDVQVANTLATFEMIREIKDFLAGNENRKAKLTKQAERLEREYRITYNPYNHPEWT